MELMCSLIPILSGVLAKSLRALHAAVFMPVYPWGDMFALCSLTFGHASSEKYLQKLLDKKCSTAWYVWANRRTLSQPGACVMISNISNPVVVAA